MFVDKADDSVLENLSAETSKAKNTKRKKKWRNQSRTLKNCGISVRIFTYDVPNINVSRREEEVYQNLFSLFLVDRA